MRGLTIMQPYAELILLGLKKIETRPRRTHHRGLLAIHAGLSRDWLNYSVVKDYPQVAWPFHSGQFGYIVGVCRVVDCFATDSVDMLDILSEQEMDFGDYSDGRFGWLLDDVRRLPQPIKYRGSQGMFNIPDDIIPEEFRQ